MSSVITQCLGKITLQTISKMKREGQKISMLTAYDFTMAGIIDRANIDIILVGDSAANVIAGYDTTLPFTLDEIIYHAKAVRRGVKRAFIVVDMPFGSYQGSTTTALKSAIKIMKETFCESVKMEGGEEIIDSVKTIVDAGIPVMGHLGLTPQSIHQLGSFSVQAKEEKAKEKLIRDAIALEKAGVFSIVLEKIPSSLTKELKKYITVPLIGIGAGNEADGQVLVCYDMLGITENFKPKFLRQYAEVGQIIKQACLSYDKDVKNGSFPNENEQY